MGSVVGVICRVPLRTEKEGKAAFDREDARYQERFKKIAEWREHLKQVHAYDEYMWTEFVV
jgi:hypothetical protein